MLSSVQPFDPPAFALACLSVLPLLLPAILGPVRRASLIEPQCVLRYESASGRCARLPVETDTPAR